MNVKSVPARITEKCMKIWNGAKHIELISGPLEYLIFHLPAEKVEPALNHLLRRNIIGQNFIEWYSVTCKCSNLEMFREVLRCLERDQYKRPLTAKDLRS